MVWIAYDIRTNILCTLAQKNLNCSIESCNKSQARVAQTRHSTFHLPIPYRSSVIVIMYNLYLCFSRWDLVGRFCIMYNYLEKSCCLLFYRTVPCSFIEILNYVDRSTPIVCWAVSAVFIIVLPTIFRVRIHWWAIQINWLWIKSVEV
jgi:hypothetical protein